MRIALVTVALAACSREPAKPRLTIGAAAVLRNVMPELVAKYRETNAAPIDVTYGASDKLVAQRGRFDVLVTAEPAGAQGKVIATTSIVLVGLPSAGITFANIGDAEKIAIGDPFAVPAGRYAREYLSRVGKWNDVAPKAVLGGDVAGVLALAQRGEAKVAIVYRTDALGADPLVILDEPADSPVVHITGSSSTANGAKLVDFLASQQARTIFAKRGFAEPR